MIDDEIEAILALDIGAEMRIAARFDLARFEVICYPQLWRRISETLYEVCPHEGIIGCPGTSRVPCSERAIALALRREPSPDFDAWYLETVRGDSI